MKLALQLKTFQWNIDPTDEDVWTFNTHPDDLQTFYQLFDENSAVDSETVGVKQSGSNMQDNWGMDEGVLIIDRNGPEDSAANIIDFRDNADSVASCTDGACTTTTSITAANSVEQAMTLTETGANTGIFRNWSEDIETNMIIASDAKRGTQATLNWNDEEYSILVMPFWGTVEFNTEYGDGIGAEWNSGEIVEVVITDGDMNYDARLGDTLSIKSNTTIVPALKIGSPITGSSLESISHVAQEQNPVELAAGVNDNVCSSDYSSADATSYNQCYEKYSERTMWNVNTADVTFANGDEFKFVYDGTTLTDWKTFVTGANGSSAYQYFQYDFRSFNGGSDNADTWVNFTVRDGSAITSTSEETEIIHMIDRSDGSDTSNLTATAMCQGLVGTCMYQGFTQQTSSVASHKTFPNVENIDNGTEEFNIFANITSFASTSDQNTTLFTLSAGTNYPFYLDVVRYGQSNDGVTSGDRHNDSIIRMEVDETDNNTGVFVAELEYIMLNQLNVNNSGTYNATKSFDDENIMVVHNDLTDEDEIRINYFDKGADGVQTQVADQLAAPTHSGVVELDNDSYKEADTVVVTLNDSDLNTNPDLINIYTVVTTDGDPAYDQVGEPYYGSNSVGDSFGRMLDITFDDETWLNSDQGTLCTAGGSDGAGTPTGDDGLGASGFTLVETGSNTGVFTGDFQIPAEYCSRSGSNTASSSMGVDIEVNYVDYRDASGEIIEVGDGAGIRGNTGSVSLDRTVYPVPFGTIGDFSVESTKSNPNGRSLFPVNSASITTLNDASETIGSGDLTIHIRVDDPDYDVSATGEDSIAENTTSSSNRGPLKIYVSRGSAQVVLATAGADTASNGFITSSVVTCGVQTETTDGSGNNCTRELGSISETAPDSGVFELDMTVRYTDGPASADCSTLTNSWTQTDGGGTAETDRFADAATSGDHCILQGDVITVEYTDQNDASGNSGVAYDSATFDLRNGVLQTDKSVYIIGSDIIMTLIEPDLDLESDESETWDLDLIEWDSDAATVTMGNLGGEASSFDPEPSDFRETGDSTGIFQIVIEVPSSLGGSALDRGELISLTYTDWGPSGADFVGDEYTDIGLDLYTSNFGATIELDQKVYTWTDKVYITIVAPDHNFDGGLVDMIGDTDDDPLIIQTRSQKLTDYKLAETGTDTGIFSGEVILKGFSHDADGDPATGTGTGYDVTGLSAATGSGPTDGAIKAQDDDGLSISYEFNEDEVVVGSALIRWNIGEAAWLDSSYPASGTGVVRIVDPDMNWDPENVDNFSIDVWSDSDAGGISLMVTETNEATGIFEGSVSFTADDESSGHRLRVAEGDTITAEYEDNTLPDPYTRSDDLDITGTAIIGTVIPPLERAPAANARVVDSFGNSLSEVSVDQQVQIEADLVNGQDRDQSFAYLVQVQDGNGVTVSLAWITGQLAAGQSFSPALSWIPSSSGSYEATVFVWESVDNPTALSDTVSVSIRVV